MNNICYLRQAIDENSETDATLYKSAFEDVDTLIDFGNYRAKHGLEAAMPLFKDVKFTWAKGSVNPIGDIMSGSVFSVRAAEFIRTLQGEYDIFEPINIEGTPAFFIALKRIDDVSDTLDIFQCKKLGRRTVVSERFKAAWEAAGLLGAEFEPIKK